MKRARRHFVVSLLLSILLFSAGARASSIELDTTIIGQVRENAADQSEVPVNGYFGLAFRHSPWKFSGEAAMRVFRDFSRELDDYDLYQAVLHLKPVEILSLDFGRQFLNQGFSAEVIDGIRLSVDPAGHFTFTLYSGMPRSVEIGDLNENDGLLTGLSVALKEVARTNAQFHLAWRKQNIRFGDIRQNDEVLTGLALSRQFKGGWRPSLYGLAEYNVAANILETGTAGIDFYPHQRLALNAEFDYFNANRDSDRPSILALFTNGPVILGRFASTVTLIPDRLDFEEGYSYQRLEVRDGDWRNGHLLETALLITIDEIGMQIQPGYYFSQSFGGTLHGWRVHSHEQFTEKWYADLGIDFARYSKVTNDNDTAFSAVLWSGYEIVKGLTLSAGMEYNRNNLFTRDVRGGFKLNYLFKAGG